ncbi:MAG: hypothetical protein KAH57_07215 [Thermoplasmata archaeon]|nr:hypothetical protein [Thermoplasmata archaeon]
MVFESLKRMFKFTKESKQEQKQVSYNRISEEIDDFEKEIQEYLKSTKERNGPPVPEGPASLSQGGAVKMTPLEEKEQKPAPVTETKGE